MALADIYVLDLKSQFLGEDLHNVFTYDSGGGGSAVELVDAFMDDVYPTINQLASSSIYFLSVYAYSLGNLGDSAEQFIDENGLNGADMLPVFNAVGYTLKTANRAVRPGSKRFAGVPEAVQVSGTITDETYVGVMETLRVALSENISDDDVTFYNPVVVKRVKYEVPDSDPVREAYRWPETDGELVASSLRLVATSKKVTHQTSRGNRT